MKMTVSSSMMMMMIMIMPLFLLRLLDVFLRAKKRVEKIETEVFTFVE